MATHRARYGKDDALAYFAADTGGRPQRQDTSLWPYCKRRRNRPSSHVKTRSMRINTQKTTRMGCTLSEFFHAEPYSRCFKIEIMRIQAALRRYSQASGEVHWRAIQPRSDLPVT